MIEAASLGSGAGAQSLGSFEALLASVRARVDERLRQWLLPRVTAANEVSAEVGMVADAVFQLTSRGGKRMRAALVAVGYEAAAGGRADESWTVCEHAMMAIELLQTYLLIHDDWMDDDDIRRGGPAVHVSLRECLGSTSLGDAAAILAGDLASAYAQQVLLETPLAPERVLSAGATFARIQAEVVTGQLAEMTTASVMRAEPSVEVIHALKTASYTVTGPLLLGASLAGGGDLRRTHLERFGRPLGIAFQLRDDLLGVFGDPAATGKPVWNDIRQGKRTALVSELRGDPRADELLGRVLGVADAKDEDLGAVVALMIETGARARVEARVRELCGEARRVLDEMAPITSELGRRWLTGAVSALGDRSS